MAMKNPSSKKVCVDVDGEQNGNRIYNTYINFYVKTSESVAIRTFCIGRLPVGRQDIFACVCAYSSVDYRNAV